MDSSRAWSESWKRAATVAVLGFMVTKRPSPRFTILPDSWAFFISWNILEIICKTKCFQSSSRKREITNSHLNSTADEQIDDIGSQGVAILVQEPVGVVPDLPGVMFDAEFHGGHSGPEVEFVESVVVVAFLEERGVCRLGKVGFVVQQMQNTNRLLGNQANHRLIILLCRPGKKNALGNGVKGCRRTTKKQMSYGESDGLPLDPFLGVLLLFQLENVLVEVELQVLVGVVDAQLLETVLLQKATKDVCFCSIQWRQPK